MYVVGQEEVEAISRSVLTRSLFRYGMGTESETFEKQFAEYLGVSHCHLTASGTTALHAAITSLGIGPGDEVIVPCHTAMGTPMAVVASGAIPVLADIDESLTMSPASFEAAIGPRVKAVIPVHLWGATCDMDRISAIARHHGIYVVEDCAQAVGGAYKGQMLGSLGDLGCFSFNYFKNISCGEGGAVVTRNTDFEQVVRCYHTTFFWRARENTSQNIPSFVSIGPRFSEVLSSMLNVQLARLSTLLIKSRGQKLRILHELAPLEEIGFKAAPAHSLDYECGTALIFQLPSSNAAETFRQRHSCLIAGQTGRHVYTDWEPILRSAGLTIPEWILSRWRRTGSVEWIIRRICVGNLWKS